MPEPKTIKAKAKKDFADWVKTTKAKKPSLQKPIKPGIKPSLLKTINPDIALPKFLKGRAGSLLKGSLPLAGTIGKIASVPIAFGEANYWTRKLLGATNPNDPYYGTNAGWLGLPDPEMFYKQAGGAELTEYAEGSQARADTRKAQATVDKVTAPMQSNISQADISAGYKIIGGYIVPVAADANGQSYLDWGNALSDKAATTQPSYQQPEGNIPTDPYGRTATWDPDNAEWRYPPDWATDPSTQQAGYISPQDQWIRDRMTEQAQQQQQQFEQQMAWDREQAQMQAEQQKQQQLAQLRANPASWLEYASLAGQTPAVQPWMVPLGQQYGMQVGGQIPGYQASGESMGLPQLTTPSAQYMARNTPSARQQYYGYEQARTGSTPEDTQWRLWQQGPPGGGFRGLRRLK